MGLAPNMRVYPHTNQFISYGELEAQGRVRETKELGRCDALGS